MSPNFRASYTETLGKLETQYCKLMVSGLPALPREPGLHPRSRAAGRGRNPSATEQGGGIVNNLINNSSCPGNLELPAEAPAELARIRVPRHC